MMCRCACFSILLLGAVPVGARAQAAAEAALGMGRAAGAAAPLKKAGERLGAVLEKAGQSADKTPRTVVLPAPSKPAPAPSYEDPGGIKTGMAYEEVLRRFGPPPFLLAGADGKTLCYTVKGVPVDVEVREGRVAAVRPARATAAVH